MRRVRHLLKGLGPGGAERLVVAQVRTRVDGPDGDLTHDVVYLVPWKDHLVPELRAAGVAARCLDSGSAARLGWVTRLRSMLRSDPVDVLHVHSPALAAISRLLVRTLPRRVRPALVVTEHNRWPRHHRLTRLANRATIRLDDAVVAVSDDVRRTIRGRSADTVEVITHGIDLAAVRAGADRTGVRAELGVGADEIMIACVANLRPEKALDRLVEAAAHALGQVPHLRYVLVGQGPQEDELAGWIERAGIGERFVALGYRDDATRIVSGADVFTMSSRHEGVPVAIMEALALGVPVAATTAGGIPEAVGRAGLLSPVDDPGALAANHVKLALDADLRRRLAAAAPGEAERFSIVRAAAELAAVYAGVTAGTEREASSQS